MKIEYEPAEQYIPDEHCVFCKEKLSAFRKSWIMLGWVRWTEEFKKDNNTYTMTRKSPVQAHEECAEKARVKT